MAQITLTTVDIILEIPDLVISDTVIKRKAQLFTMTYNQHAKYLTLNWTIQHYANNAGGYGAYVGDSIPDKTKESIADNSVMVDVTTGTILIPDSSGNYDQSINYAGQYDWFNMIAETQPIKVHDMIRQYGAAADWMNVK